MKRRKFVFGSLWPLPLYSFTGFKSLFTFGKPFRVSSGETRFGKHYKMRGVTLNTLDLKISGKDTDHVLAVFEQIGQTPNGGPPLHIHLDQDEWFFVTEGEYLFQCGQEQFRMKAGDTLFLPRNVPHAFIQLTDRARTIVSYLPAGKMEEFFAVTDSWNSPPSREEIAKTFLDHGMKVVGEPLKIN